MLQGLARPPILKVHPLTVRICVGSRTVRVLSAGFFLHDRRGAKRAALVTHGLRRPCESETSLSRQARDALSGQGLAAELRVREGQSHHIG
jgi:hypothetical protein